MKKRNFDALAFLGGLFIVGLFILLALSGAGKEQLALSEENTTIPIVALTTIPTVVPTDIPTVEPTEAPTMTPTEVPTVAPTAETTAEPTEEQAHVEVVDRFTIKIFAKMPEIDQSFEQERKYISEDFTFLEGKVGNNYVQFVNDRVQFYQFNDHNLGRVTLYGPHWNSINVKQFNNFTGELDFLNYLPIIVRGELPTCIQEEYTYTGGRPCSITPIIQNGKIEYFVLYDKKAMWKVKNDEVLDSFNGFNMENCIRIDLDDWVYELNGVNEVYSALYTTRIPEDCVLEGKTVEQVFLELGGEFAYILEGIALG